MSAVLIQAGILKTHLEANVPELSGINVVIDEQKDLGSEIKKAVAKAKGAAIIISPESGKNTDLESDELNMMTSIVIAVITKPVKRGKDEVPALDVKEQVMKAAHGLPLLGTTHCSRCAKVSGWQQVNHPAYLIYKIDLTTPTTIT